jgi:hypothetical protein
MTIEKGIMHTSSQSLAVDFLARWSDAVLSCSTLAEQQRRELVEWFIHLAQGLSKQEKNLARALRFKDELGRAVEDSAADWLRLMVSQQAFCGEQMGKAVEVLRARSVSDVQAAMASLSESAQGLWRVGAHTCGRAGARLMQPWTDFWLLPGVEPADG